MKSHNLSAINSAAELEVPEIIIKLADFLNNNTSNTVRPTFAKNFLEAIPLGKDMSLIKHQLSIFIQTQNIKRVRGLNYTNKIKIIAVIKQCIQEHKKALEGSETDFKAVRSAVKSAELETWSAAQSVSELLMLAVSESSIILARLAESASWSVYSAIRSAAWLIAADSESWLLMNSVKSATKSAIWSGESAIWLAWSGESAKKLASWSKASARSALILSRSASRAVWSDLIAAELIHLLTHKHLPEYENAK